MKENSVATFPPISCEKQLNDIFYRLCWYTSPALERISTITIPTTSDSIEVGELPSSFDSSINDYLASYEAQTDVRKLSSKEIMKVVKSADLIIVLDKKAYDMKMNDQSFRQLRGKKRVIEFVIDTKGCDSNILNLLSAAFDFKELMSFARQRIDAIDRSKLKTKGYVLGTGPSLSSVMDLDLSDGSTIVCNSIVKNAEMLEKIKPDFIVAADPIFHSGCSSYAQEFRQNVIDALQKYNSFFIVPIRDYHIYRFYFPKEYTDKIIPMPFYFEGKTINFDFDKTLGVTITANVLTLLLLPVAAYFFDEIGIAGCDGRPLSDNSYYWGHDPSAQYTDKMSDIQKDHPGFFNIDFNEYYIKHCDVLDRWINGIESYGKKVVSITPSYIPALGERSAEGVHRYDEILYTEIEEAINSRRDIEEWRAINGEPSSELSQKVAKRIKENTFEIIDLKNYPKVLVLSTSAIGSLCATGDLKKKLFKGWPEDRLMQVYTSPDPKVPAANLHRFSATTKKSSRLFDLCMEFAPDVIYFRPTDSPREFFDFAEKLINSLNTGLVTHVMDDWPQRLAYTNEQQFTVVDQSLRNIMDRSDYRLSICDQMSQCYKERYGCSFFPISNCMYPEDIHRDMPSNRRKNDKSFTIRYSGGLADDMSRQSVSEVAHAVHELSAEYDIKFQINTMDWCFDVAGALANRYNAVFAYPLISPDEYMDSMQAADLLLIAYNFDETSKRYTHLSFANKMPEYMATSTPILAYGPRDIATIDYIAGGEFAVVVDGQGVQPIKDAILKVIEDPNLADNYAKKAIEQLQLKHDANMVIPQFQSKLVSAAMQHGWSEDKTPVRKAFDGMSSIEGKVESDASHIVSDVFASKNKSSDDVFKSTVNIRPYKPLVVPRINPASISFTQHKSLLRDLSDEIEERNPAIAGLLNIIDHWVLVLKKSLFGFGGLALGSIACFALAGLLIPDHAFLLFGVSGALSAGLFLLLTISYFNKVIGEIVSKQDVIRDRQIAQLVKDINGVLDSQHQAILQISAKKFSINETQINNLIDNFKKENNIHSAEIGDIQKNIDENCSRIEALRKEFNDDFDAQAMRIDNATDMSEQNLKRIEDLSLWVQSQSAVLNQVQHNADGLESVKEQLQALPGINARWFNAFSREVTKADMDLLRSKWMKPLNSTVSMRELGYIANDICCLETQSYGRFAAHVQDVLARCIVARSITAKNINILEIGCLFGVHLFSLYRACESKFDSIHLTALDHFEGYYDKGAADIVTGQVVSELTFLKNMEIANVPANDVTIVKHLSQDKEAFEAVKDTQFHMIVVDGDHSYAGIANDVETYSQLVVKGGYIVIDDYNSKEWPQVDHYIDVKMRNSRDFKLVAEGWKTAVFMKL